MIEAIPFVIFIIYILTLIFKFQMKVLFVFFISREVFMRCAILFETVKFNDGGDFQEGGGAYGCKY